MFQWIHIRVDGIGGRSIPVPQIQTAYASGLDFEPMERRFKMLEDGSIRLAITSVPFMLHVKMHLPLYGTIWVMAHNRGKGYDCSFVDFTSEAIRTYIYEAERYAGDIVLSPETAGHLEAARELSHLADRGNNTGENRLYALSHAVYAAEGALFEHARRQVSLHPRPDLMLGCNFMRYSSANSIYSRLFKDLFDYATLPFYPRDTAPAEDVFDYSYIRAALPFLKEHHITVKGHPLWFGHKEVNPDWLMQKKGAALQKSAHDIAYHHVKTFRSDIHIWDSINEAHDWSNCFEQNHRQSLELTRICCQALKEADPQAESVINICLPFAEYVAGRYNCYGSLPESLWSPAKYISEVIKSDIHFDIIGIQLYFPARDMIAVDKLLTVFEKFGKPLHITEMGVNGGVRHQDNAASGWAQMSMSEGSWHGGWNERTQADWMEQFYTIAASHNSIKALTWWDFIEPSFSGNGAFLYDDETPKEIYFRLKALKRILKNGSSTQQTHGPR